jgi:Fis family transcriptional regulator
VANAIGFLLIALLVMALAALAGKSSWQRPCTMGWGWVAWTGWPGRPFGFFQGALLVTLVILVAVAFFPRPLAGGGQAAQAVFRGLSFEHAHEPGGAGRARAAGAEDAGRRVAPQWMHPRQRRIDDFKAGATQAKYGKLRRARGNVRRELDSLVTQMHSSGIRYEEAVREFKKQYLREVLDGAPGKPVQGGRRAGDAPQHAEPHHGGAGTELAEVRAGLKRPPRSERPVFSAVRQGYRQG